MPAHADYHFHPHYRAQTPLDAFLLKTKSGSDEFVTEVYYDRIAAILSEWSSSILQSPRGIATAGRFLTADFVGSSHLPVESRIVRPGPALEVRRLNFSQQTSLPPDAFLRDLQAAVNGFSKIITAEFQVTRLDALSPGRLRTRVRYELVGSGSDYFREQRIGDWELDWTEYRVRRWQAIGETRARSAKPWYVNITQAAFGSNSSYTGQMLHGVDYWRTVLDGASGIDIYGHNGVSVGDIDGDGFDDLYICQPAGLPNRLYRNRGDGTFEDITEASGVGILENTACAIFADFDNDGRQDLIVVRANGPLLFLNQGGGKFRLHSGAFQFATPPRGAFTGAAAADYDRDGWLDIYFCLYIYYQGTDQYNYPTPYYAAENGPPNFMLRNNRDGTFRDVTVETQLDRNNTRYSFCCGWGDSNKDGWPDLYVVNDFGRKNLYRNNGDGTFTDIAPQAGVEDIGAGMSVCWLDYNNDGFEDLYIADMWTAAGERISMQPEFLKGSPDHIRAMYRKHAMGNSLFRDKGDGTFADATAAAQVEMGRWAWSSDSWDFDHDGFADIYIANGMLSGPIREDLNSFFWRQVVANSPGEAKASSKYEQGWNAINELVRSDYSWSGYERNVFYANNRDGTLSNVSAAIGLDFVEDGRAFALADFDHDGRQELFLKSRNGPQLRLLKNVTEQLPPSIAFRLRGTKSHPDAIGAAVTVEAESGGQTRLLQAGSGFLSQHSKELFFGLGRSKGPVNASIRWPSGLVQQIDGLPINHRIWIEEGVEPARIEAFRAPSAVRERSSPQPTDILPTTSETWLLVPVTAPDFTLQGRTLASLRGEPVLLTFSTADSRIDSRTAQLFQLVTVNAEKSDDIGGIYNILYRRLFDRRRDLSLPTSFLIDEAGDIVKIYQGPVHPAGVEEDIHRIPRTAAERLASALPFAGISSTYDYGRNYVSFGSAFFERGYYGQAEASFRSALRDDPSSAEALYGLGSVFLKQEKLNEARDSFTRTVKLNASYPETLPNAWNNLGLLATREGRIDEAIGYFQESLKINPDYWIALENIGNAYRQEKRWDEARAALERAIEIQPRDPEVNYNLGMVFAQTGDTGRASEYLLKALQLRPVYPEALNNLAVLYLRTGRRDEAVRTFEECVRVAPAFDQSYLNLARVYVLENAPDKARALLLELLKKHPGHPQAAKALDQLQ